MKRRQEAGREPGSPLWKDYIRLTKPRIIQSNLITAFGGFWVASAFYGGLDWLLMVYMLLGSTLVMASACVLNNYLDREMDQKMARTRERALPAGRLQPQAVMNYGIVLGIAGLLVLGFLVNTLSLILGAVGMLTYIWIYTAWLKRTSTLSTVVGGIAGSMPPVIGFCAVSGVMDAGAWVLFAILFLWQPPHFLALGVRRMEEYRAAGFPLLPVVHGVEATKLQMLRYVAALVPVSLLMHYFGYVGKFYLVSAFVLGFVWFLLAAAGFRKKLDEVRWARSNFSYSLLYLIALFVIMMADAGA